MNERWLENPRQDGFRHSNYVTNLLVGGARRFFLVGVGAVAARRVRPEFVPTRPVGDPGAELLRILDDVRFGDLKLGRQAPLCDRQGTA